MGTVALIILAVAIAAMVVVFLVRKRKENKVETKPKEEPEKPSVVQEPSKPEKSVCEGCNNFEACIDCENGSRWAHIQEPVVEPKFKVGDKVHLIDGTSPIYEDDCIVIGEIDNDTYYGNAEGGWFKIADQDKYELVEPEKPKEEEKGTDVIDFFAPFEKIVDVKKESKTIDYLYELGEEALFQFFEGRSVHGLPELFKEENFPNIFNFYGEDGDKESAIKTLVGWLFAMQLAELRPQDRTAIYKIGYEMGGCNKDSKLYGWRFKCDPNICRLVAAAIYAAMRGVCKPDVDSMRVECGGISISDTIEEVKESDSFDLDQSYYIDLREFMPTAAGPYAPNYQDRSKVGGYPYPNDAKTDDYNLAIDRAIRDYIVETYKPVYMDNYKLRTVQAIADKDADCNHLFGKTRQVEQYWFEPVFTAETLGQEVYPSLAKELCSLVDDVLNIGASQRCILQGHEGQENPPQYGRLRPGCSWQVEAHRHSDDDDTQNVLVDFFIEDNDGNPTGYYNQDGEWVNKDGIHSPEEYNDVMKDELWANSYPSGHSAGIMSACLLLIELLPKQADKILAATNRFAVNRTIARYHWNSDTIQGRVLATCITPIIRCCSDWKERFKKALECLKSV